MSWVRILIHIVFSTKNREYRLNKDIRESLFKHITANAEQKDIYLDSLGGYYDHIHCLVSLGRQQTISRIAQLIKGESSFWLNKNYFKHEKFQWQDDYWATSVSVNDSDSLRMYILNQEEHHKDYTFEKEIDLLMNRF